MATWFFLGGTCPSFIGEWAGTCRRLPTPREAKKDSGGSSHTILPFRQNQHNETSALAQELISKEHSFLSKTRLCLHSHDLLAFDSFLSPHPCPCHVQVHVHMHMYMYICVSHLYLYTTLCHYISTHTDTIYITISILYVYVFTCISVSITTDTCKFIHIQISII